MKPPPERVYIFWTSQVRVRVGQGDPGPAVSPSVGPCVGITFKGTQKIGNGVMFPEEMVTLGPSRRWFSRS